MHGKYKSLALAVFTTVAIPSLGCSFQPKEGAGLGGGAAGAAPGSGGGLDASGLDRSFTTQDVSGAVSGDACPANTFTASNLPPDLLIVLDRSGSMDETADGTCKTGCGANSKWSQMTTAINQVVTASQAQVRWGLKLFASPAGGGRNTNGCTVNAGAEVAPNVNTGMMIAAAITNGTPGSSTPTRAAETQAAAYLLANTDVNPKYILLATDGIPNCPATGNMATADDAAAIAAVTTVASMGIPTFVIGVATSGSTADTTLNAMAVSGGHPRAGTPQYYPVSSSAELTTVLSAIQGMVALPCQFQLPGVPSNLTAVSVTLGGQAVAMTDWMYGPGNRSIIFPDSGTICMQLKDGTVKDVRISLPCGETIIP